jgi:hypothetical protein
LTFKLLHGVISLNTELLIIAAVRTSGVDWIDVAQDMDQWKVLVNMVLNLRVSQNAGKFLSGCTISGFSRRAQLRE